MPHPVTKYTRIAAHFAFQIRDVKYARGSAISVSDPDAQALEEFYMSLSGMDSRLKTWRTVGQDGDDNPAAILENHTKYLLMGIRGLKKAFDNGASQEAEALLTRVEAQLKIFEEDYKAFKAQFGDVIQNNPQMVRFDQRWQKADTFSEGLSELERLNIIEPIKKEDASKENLKGEAPKPEAEKKESASAIELEEEDDLPPLNINDTIAENQRELGQVGRERKFEDPFNDGETSYNGVLGACQREWENHRDTADHRDLLSRVLAAAQLRKEGASYDYRQVRIRAAEIRTSPNFDDMIENKVFLDHALTHPLDIDNVLEVWEREQKAGDLVTIPTDYDQFIRKNTWPHVPRKAEVTCLAYAVAAYRLRNQGVPFNPGRIQHEADKLLTSKGFQWAMEDSSRIRKWLYGGKSLDVADHLIADRELHDQNARKANQQKGQNKVNAEPPKEKNVDQKQGEPQNKVKAEPPKEKNVDQKQGEPQNKVNAAPPENEVAQKAADRLKNLTGTGLDKRMRMYRCAALMPENQLTENSVREEVENVRRPISVFVSDLRKAKQLDLAELAKRGPALVRLATQMKQTALNNQEALKSTMDAKAYDQLQKHAPTYYLDPKALSQEICDNYSYILKTASEAEKKTEGYKALEASVHAMNARRWSTVLNDENTQDALSTINEKLQILTQQKRGLFLSSTNSPLHVAMTTALTRLNNKIQLMQGKDVQMDPKDKAALEKESLRDIFQAAQKHTLAYYRERTKNGTSSYFVHNVGQHRADAAMETLKQLSILDRKLKLQSKAEWLVAECQLTILNKRSDKTWMAENLQTVAAEMVYALAVQHKNMSRGEETIHLSNVPLQNGIDHVRASADFKRMVQQQGSSLADRIAEGPIKLTNAWVQAVDAPKAVANRRDPQQMTEIDQQNVWKQHSV